MALRATGHRLGILRLVALSGQNESSTEMVIQLQNPNLFRTQAYVGGEWKSAATGGALKVVDPATGEEIGSVPMMSESEASQAVASAKSAFSTWSKTSAFERSELLMAWYERIIENSEDLARIMTLEQGKPLAEARGEVQGGAAYVKWFAEEAKRIDGEIISSPMSDRRFFVLREPVGVAALITPWNFPIGMVTRKVAPALGAGCTVVVKPAEQTPLTALALADLAHEAGIPAGVLNVVTGEPEVVGSVLSKDPRVSKISFTGSTEVGRLLMENAAPSVKKLSMELGGNAPVLVFDDADIELSVEQVLLSKFRNAGQTCVSANRVLVHAPIYADFVARLKDGMSKLVVGNGFANDTTVGPLIDKRATDKVKTLLADAVAKGAKLLVGGEQSKEGPNFFQPTLLSAVTAEMDVFQSEVFGPVLPIIKFDDEDEAIDLANQSDFGLAAYVYSTQSQRIWRVQGELQYGTVVVNTGAFGAPMAPFGGVKQSGFGREGSRYGLDEYMTLKWVCHAGL